MNDIYAKQILKIFANNPFDSFNHKQVESRIGVHDKGSRQLVMATILVLAEAKILIEDENLDIVLFDLPGTIRSKGVLSTLSQMDYIFVPISADRLVLESALQFVANFKDNLMTTGKAVTKEICLFWTMVDGREKTDIYNLYDEVIGELGISVLNTRIPDSKRFRRDFSEPEKAVFRSTIFLPDQHLLRGSRIK